MTDDNLTPAIRVKHLTKSFKIPLDKGQSIKGRVLGRVTGGYREFTPLNDINFTINKGDFFGIVGRNGSGKSTLLRTIAGVYQPTKGKVVVDGKLIPFIELGVGFNPGLTGRENVYLSAALLGFSRKEVDAMYEDIVDFAELHDFMEERLQNYSSGMQVRLAFSISIRAKGDILLLDEVLAVGDTAFQQKCYNYFRQLKKEKRTVVLVTHNMTHVEEFCNRGLLLNNGKIECIGSSEEVASAYRELFSGQDPKELSGSRLGEQTNGIVDIRSVEIAQGREKTTNIEAGRNFDIIVRAKLKDARYSDFNFSIDIRNGHDMLLVSASFASINKELFKFIENQVATIYFKIENVLGNGNYYVSLKARASKDEGRSVREDVVNLSGIAQFKVTGHKYHAFSLVHPRIKTEEQNIIKRKLLDSEL